jgi:hypothetical protein
MRSQSLHKLVATPQGILLDGLPLTKHALAKLPPEAQGRIKRAGELFAKVKKEDWDNRTPHAMNDMPVLAQAQMELALAMPQTLDKYNFNPDQPRDPNTARWVDVDGDPGEPEENKNRVSVTVHSNKNITIHNADGSSETRVDGSHAWRNNNPGSIKPGDFANRHGAIGSAGGLAVFPDEATGEAAQEALLRGPSYSQLTVDQAVARRSPPPENDTARTQELVRQFSGLFGTEKINELSNDQFHSLALAIRRAEGWRQGTVTQTRAK